MDLAVLSFGCSHPVALKFKNSPGYLQRQFSHDASASEAVNQACRPVYDTGHAIALVLLLAPQL
jgi:hypothetical protein